MRRSYERILRRPITGLRRAIVWSVARRGRLLVAVVIVSAVGLIPVLVLPTNSDVAWLLFSAERVLEGATLYADLIEVNPPLIVWLSVPPVAVAEALDVRSRIPFLVYVLVLALLSLRLSWHLLGQLEPGLSIVKKRAYLLLLVVALFVLQGWVYGQREHLMAVFVVPYALALAVRLTGGTASGRALLGAGVLGGLGFALKPYYLPTWIGLELYHWHASRRTADDGSARGPLDVARRPELAAALVVVATYAAAVVFLTPEYFDMGRRLAPIYVGIWQTTPWELAGHPVTLMSLFALAALVLSRLDGTDAVVARVFAVVLAFWLVGAVAQIKGWWYHFYPALAVASLVLSVVVMGDRSEGRNQRRFNGLLPLVGLLVLLGAVGGRIGEAVTALREGADFDRRLPVTTNLVRNHVGEDGNLAVLSPHIHAAFPLVNRAGVRWELRFNSMWVPEVVYSEAITEEEAVSYRPPDEMEPPERYFWESTLADLTRDPPEVLLFDRQRLASPGFDYRDYFGRDLRFRRLMATCEPLGIIGRFSAHRCGDGAARGGGP